MSDDQSSQNIRSAITSGMSSFTSKAIEFLRKTTDIGSDVASNNQVVSGTKWVVGFIIGIFLTWINFQVVDSISGKLLLLVIFPLVYTFIFRNYGETLKNSYKISGIWTIVAIIIPYAIYYLAGISHPSIDNFLSIAKLYVLAWPLWMCVAHKSESFISNFLEFLLILFVIGSLLLQVWGSITFSDGLLNDYIRPEDKALFTDTTSRIWEIAKDVPSKGFAAFAQFWNDSARLYNNTQQFILTGKTYEERVDENSPTDSLGVTFESFDFSIFDGKYKQGSEVSGWAILEANSLDTPIEVVTFCKIDPKTDPFTAEVNVNSFTAFNYNIRDIICTVGEGVLEKVDTHEMRVFADFNYTTSAYVRRYFMKQTDLSELQRNNIDPLTQYQIPRNDDASKFTNGPIQLQIIKSSLIQGVQESGNTDLVIGIRIDNNRKFNIDGKIKRINTLGLALPPGFKLKTKANGEFSCSGADIEPMSEEVCKARCVINNQLDNRCAIDCDEYEYYTIDVPTQNDRASNYEDYVKTPSQISCTVETNVAIFEDSPLAIKNFRAFADYTYQISTGRSFSMLKDENYQGSDFKEISYCKDTYSMFTDETSSSTPVIMDTAKEFVSLIQTENLQCPEIIKGIVAFNYRSGSQTGNGVGATGANIEYINSAFDSPVSQSELSKDSVTFTNEFIRQILEKECTLNEKPSMDCALNIFYCGANRQCGPTKVVMSLANEYANEN